MGSEGVLVTNGDRVGGISGGGGERWGTSWIDASSVLRLDIPLPGMHTLTDDNG